MYLSESLQKKWEGVLDHPDLPKIEDKYKKAVTAVVLENQAIEMQKSGQVLSEAVPTNSASLFCWARLALSVILCLSM